LLLLLPEKNSKARTRDALYRVGPAGIFYSRKRFMLHPGSVALQRSTSRPVRAGKKRADDDSLVTRSRLD
jgi:hypothetical protein